MKHLNVKSYAKINISLDVKRLKEDGYHELDSVMVPLEMHDSLLISLLKGNSDTFVTCDDFSNGNIKYNLATFAIDKLASLYGFNNKFRVFIHKVIPMQAGLGGGSSNAAATLKAINKMLKLNISDEELIQVGKTLGADVPFFIMNKPCRAKGIGEKLEPIEIKNDYYCLIVKPTQGLSTKDVFKKADELTLKTGNIDDVVTALENGDDELLEKSIFNSLEEPAEILLPEIKIIKNELKELGLRLVLMSGSGSAIFALSRDKKILKQDMKALEDRYVVELTKILK